MSEEKIYGSMEDILGASEVEYRIINGFREGEKVQIGSVSAGDMIEWSEASEGEAKRTAGLRLLCKSLVGPAPEYKRYADDPKNITKFRALPHKTVQRIVEEILDLNGLRVKQDEKAKND